MNCEIKANKLRILIFFPLLIPLLSGGCSSSDPEKRGYPCQTIQTDWQDSKYVLPFPIGKAYKVNQGNCSGYGHSNFWNHGYDIIMDIGTVVTAARTGVVGWAEEGCKDGDRKCTNLITIIHSDKTVALYSHLTLGGVRVHSGDSVKVGQEIGLSGNTGNTGGLPHLHFSVHPCNELPGLPNAGVCPSAIVNFRNTEINQNGLEAHKVYMALPYLSE